MEATTTRLMAAGAMCSGAPGAWAPFGGTAGTDANGIDVDASAVAVPGHLLSR